MKLIVPLAKSIISSNLEIEPLPGVNSVRFTGDGNVTVNNDLVLVVKQTEFLVDRNNPNGSAQITFFPLETILERLNTHNTQITDSNIKGNNNISNQNLKMKVEINISHVKSFQILGNGNFEYHEETNSVRYSGAGILTLESGIELHVAEAQVTVEKNSHEGSVHITIVPFTTTNN